jgi:hypothetical protein
MLLAGCTSPQYSTPSSKADTNLKFVSGNSAVTSSGTDNLVYTYLITNSTFKIQNPESEPAKNVYVQIDMIAKSDFEGMCPEIQRTIEIGDIAPMSSADGFYSAKIYATCHYNTVSTIFSG